MEVWPLAPKLTKLVYQHRKNFPDEEKFGLSSQIRRAAVSMPSNVAEGWGRHDRAEFIQFLRRANGSLVEVETQLSLSADLEFSTPQEVDGLLKQTQILGKKILNLERSLERYQSKWNGSGTRPRSPFAIRCSQRTQSSTSKSATKPAAPATS